VAAGLDRLGAVSMNLHIGGYGHWSLHCLLKWRHDSAAPIVTEQPFLGTALLTSLEEGARKGALKKAHF